MFAALPASLCRWGVFVSESLAASCSACFPSAGVGATPTPSADLGAEGRPRLWSHARRRSNRKRPKVAFHLCVLWGKDQDLNISSRMGDLIRLWRIVLLKLSY